MRHLLAAICVVLLGAPALAQKAPLGDSAKSMLENKWEFSNADRDKRCTVTFESTTAGAGYKLEFDPNCASLFPVVRDIVSWKYPDDDLLYLLDAQGRALIEFSEVEDGMFEAPTPGLGVLFLQNPANAAPAPTKKGTDVAGNWLIKRGETTVCSLTLTAGPSGDTFPLAVNPGCDPAISKLNFTQWRLESGELDLLPANGDPWRFEDAGDVWRRLTETKDQMTLERQ